MTAAAQTSLMSERTVAVVSLAFAIVVGLLTGRLREAERRFDVEYPRSLAAPAAKLGRQQVDNPHHSNRAAIVEGRLCGAFSAGPDVTLLEPELLGVLHNPQLALGHMADHVVLHHIFGHIGARLDDDVDRRHLL
jgi:hypothetical protein